MAQIEVGGIGECENTDKLCRVCLVEGAPRGRWLHEARSEGTLASMVMALARVEIRRQDGLPDVICGDCLGELEAAYGFRLKCERSDSALRKIRPIPEPVKQENAEDDSRIIKEEYKDDFSESSLRDDNYSEDDSMNVEFTKNNSKRVPKVKTTTKSKIRSSKQLEDSSEIKIENDFKEVLEENNIEKAGVKGRGFACDVCGRPLSSARSLQHHKQRMHSAEKALAGGRKTGWGAGKRFHCSECPYSTPRQQALLYHARTHSGERPYACSQCPARFSQPGTLKGHLARHSDVMRFSCALCGKQFKLKEVYESHKLVHSDVKAFICNICNKGLKSKKSLAIHIRRHLNIRNYSCERCGATFVDLASLMNHSKCHVTTKKYECNFCGFKSKSKPGLTDHIKRHTSERVYKCSLCDYASVVKYAIKTHMMKHTQEKKYSCPVCQLKMSRSTCVNKHMLRLHGIRYKFSDHKDRRVIL